MTREEFTEKVKTIFGWNEPNQYSFICFDEYHTRIGFNPTAEHQYTEFITDYKLLDRLVILTNNKNIKVFYSIPADGGNFCEIIIEGFTISK